MSWRFQINPGTGWVDLTNYNGRSLVPRESIELKRDYHNKGRSTIDTLSFELIGVDGPLVQALYNQKTYEPIDIIVDRDGGRYFTGYVRPVDDYTAQAEGVVETTIALEAVDRLWVLQHALTAPYRRTDVTVETMTRELLVLGGISAGDILFSSPLPQNIVTVDLKAGDQEYLEILDELLYEFHHCLRASQDGVVEIVNWKDDPAINPVGQFSESIEAISSAKTDDDYGYVRVNHYQATQIGSDDSTGTVLLHESKVWGPSANGHFDDDDSATYVARLNFNIADDAEILNVSNLRATFRHNRLVNGGADDTGVGTWTPFQIRSFDGRLILIEYIWTRSHIRFRLRASVRLTYNDADRTVTVQVDFERRIRWQPRNTGRRDEWDEWDYGFKVIDFSVEITGSATYRQFSESVTKRTSGAGAANARTEIYDAEYIYDSSDGSSLATAILQLRQYGSKEWAIRSAAYVPVGAVVTIVSLWGLSVRARVRSLRDSQSNAGDDGYQEYEYVCESLESAGVVDVPGVSSSPSIPAFPVPRGKGDQTPTYDEIVGGVDGSGALTSLPTPVVAASATTRAVSLAIAYAADITAGSLRAELQISKDQASWFAPGPGGDGIDSWRAGVAGDWLEIPTLSYNHDRLPLAGDAANPLQTTYYYRARIRTAPLVSEWSAPVHVVVSPSLEGDIGAKTVTAEKISVEDLEALGADIAGWKILEHMIASPDDTMRFREDRKRVEILDDLGNLKAALGYLSGVATFDANQYGLYIAPGNAVRLDGGIALGQGDSAVQSDASITILDSLQNTVGRFGSLGEGEVGLLFANRNRLWRMVLTGSSLRFDSLGGTEWLTQGRIGGDDGGISSTVAWLRGLISPAADLSQYDIGLPPPAGARVFSFDNTYTDLGGADPFTVKTNLIFTPSERRFGTHSLRHNGSDGTLTAPALVRNDQNWSLNAWVRRGLFDLEAQARAEFSVQAVGDVAGSLHETVFQYERLAGLPTPVVESVAVQMLVTGSFIVSDTPTLGGSAPGVAYSPDGQLLAVAHLGVPYLTVIDTTTWTVVAGTPTLPGAGYAVAFSPDGQSLAAAHSGPPGLTVIDTTTWTVVAGTPAVDFIAFAVAYSPDGQSLGVGHFAAPRLTVINTTTWTVVAGTPSLPGTASGVAYSPDGQSLAIAHSEIPYLTVVDTTTWTVVSGTPSLPGTASGVAYSPDGQSLAIAHSEIPYLTVVDTTTWTVVSGTPSLPGTASGVAYSPDGQSLAIAHSEIPYLTVVDTTTWTVVSGTPSLPGTGRAVAFSPDGQSLAAAHSGSPGLTVIDIRRPPLTPPVGYDATIPAEVAAGAAAGDVAMAIAGALSSDLAINVGVLADTVTITQTNVGGPLSAADVDSGFAISTTRPGFYMETDPPVLMEIGSDIAISHYAADGESGLSLFVSGQYRGFVPVFADGWSLVHVEHIAYGDTVLWVNGQEVNAGNSLSGGPQDVKWLLASALDTHIGMMLVLPESLLDRMLLSLFYSSGVPWGGGIDYLRDLLFAPAVGGSVHMGGALSVDGALSADDVATDTATINAGLVVGGTTTVGHVSGSGTFTGNRTFSGIVNFRNNPIRGSHSVPAGVGSGAWTPPRGLYNFTTRLSTTFKCDFIGARGDGGVMTKASDLGTMIATGSNQLENTRGAAVTAYYERY